MNYDRMKACLSEGKRPKGMGYGDYSAMMKAEDEEPMSQEDYESMDEDDEDDEEDDEEESRKSLLSTDELNKALDAYGDVADSVGGGATRQEVLEARMKANTITKSERRELGRIWAGEAPAESGGTIRKSLRDHVNDIDTEAGELIDGSDILETITSAIGTSLDELGKSVSADGRATRALLNGQGELIKATVRHLGRMGEVIAQQDQIVKALGARLQAVEATPAAPRGVNKSDAGVPRQLGGNATAGAMPLEGNLTKSQVTEGLQQLLVKAVDVGDQQAADRLQHAGAKFESSGQIDRDVLVAVEQHVKQNAA